MTGRVELIGMIRDGVVVILGTAAEYWRDSAEGWAGVPRATVIAVDPGAKPGEAAWVVTEHYADGTIRVVDSGPLRD